MQMFLMSEMLVLPANIDPTVLRAILNQTNCVYFFLHRLI